MNLVIIPESPETQSNFIRKKLESMAWSMKVDVCISQMFNQKTRVIIFIVIPFEYSQTQVSSRGAMALLDFSFLGF